MRSLLLSRFKSVFVIIFSICALVACGGGNGNGAINDNSSSENPGKPSIERFAADPAYLLAGSIGTSLLTWQVSGADRLSITPDVGAVATGAGRTSVKPVVTTEYTLLAENDQGSDSATVTVTVGTAEPAGADAYGDVPAGLPARLCVGLMEDPGETWMQDSGVAWDLRYHYFTKGWRDNWGWDATNSGQWGRSWMDACDAQGFIPAIQYYCMNNEPGGGEDQFYNKTRNAATMASYFDDFKVLMQRAREFGQPVLVMLEGDGFAYMEIQSGDNPDAYAAVADTGMPELAGLSNTAAGWGLAFLQIRKAVGASNVILGMHISAWATGNDIAYYQTAIPLQPEVDKAYAFLAKLGLAANITGATYDVLVGDPLDRDSDYYRLTQGQDRWWDADDSAAIDTKSFNRYAEWLRLWNRTAGLRWVLWQIPLGNSNHLNVYNNGDPRQGYRDNRPEYFFGAGAAHLQKFADAGTIALLFGPGAGGQSFFTNDFYDDGQLFMQSRAGAFLNAGGLPIVTQGN